MAHLYTWDWVLELLSQRASAANAAWADLVRDVCDAKLAAVGTYSFGDEQIAALLATAHATTHPQFGELVAAAKRAFPYAPCFGANGALGDFKAPAAAKPKRKR